ncbi:Auxin-induced protein 15A, partial [Glycine soja]
KKKIPPCLTNQISTIALWVCIQYDYLKLYVGEKKKQFVIPMYGLKQISFKDLLSQAEQEFGYNNHAMGGLAIP